MQGGVPRDDNDVSVTGEEGSVQRAGDKRPQGAAGESVVFEDPADEESRLRDGGGKGDGEVGVKLALGTEDGREESNERADIRQACGVVLHAAAKRGEVMHGAFTPAEEFLEALSQAEFLVGRDGDGAAEGINDHASVSDALRWKLSFLVAEPQAEFVS
jgi:hypothetical protein